MTTTITRSEFTFRDYTVTVNGDGQPVRANDPYPAWAAGMFVTRFNLYVTALDNDTGEWTRHLVIDDAPFFHGSAIPTIGADDVMDSLIADLALATEYADGDIGQAFGAYISDGYCDPDAESLDAAFASFRLMVDRYAVIAALTSAPRIASIVERWNDR